MPTPQSFMVSFMPLIWSPAHMATFAKVVDLNGFTAAAKALKVPKAAVSRAIADLERELGLKVLTRTTRRIHLTPAGEQLLPHCRTILEAVEQVRQRSAELTEQRGGPLRVLAEVTYGGCCSRRWCRASSNASRRSPSRSSSASSPTPAARPSSTWW
jgi:DNA-binding transcriptional LysR family regulator